MDTQRACIHNCRVVTNIISCYSLVRLYRSVGVRHHFDFSHIRFPDPDQVGRGLNKAYIFILTILLLTRPSTTASTTPTSRPTTRTLSTHGAAFYTTSRTVEKLRPPGSPSPTSRTPCTTTRRRDAPPSTRRRVRPSTRTIAASTTASGTNLRRGSRLISLGF